MEIFTPERIKELASKDNSQLIRENLVDEYDEATKSLAKLIGIKYALGMKNNTIKHLRIALELNRVENEAIVKLLIRSRLISWNDFLEVMCIELNNRMDQLNEPEQYKGFR